MLPDFYALLRASVNHQVHLARKGTDGRWHLPPMQSPEYPLCSLDGCAGGDTAYQLSLLAWGLRTLQQTCDLLPGCEDARHALFDDVRTNLADLPVSRDMALGWGRGLMISREVLANTSHRHYSHMLACWNTGVLDWDKPDDRQVRVRLEKDR